MILKQLPRFFLLIPDKIPIRIRPKISKKNLPFQALPISFNQIISLNQKLRLLKIDLQRVKNLIPYPRSVLNRLFNFLRGGLIRQIFFIKEIVPRQNLRLFVLVDLLARVEPKINQLKLLIALKMVLMRGLPRLRAHVTEIFSAAARRRAVHKIAARGPLHRLLAKGAQFRVD